LAIRFTTDSERVKVLKELHRTSLRDSKPISPEAIDFLFEYVETLETELAHWSNISPKPMKPQDEAYYNARGTAFDAVSIARKAASKRA